MNNDYTALYEKLTKPFTDKYELYSFDAETLDRAFKVAWDLGHANGEDSVKDIFGDIIWVLKSVKN